MTTVDAHPDVHRPTRVARLAAFGAVVALVATVVVGVATAGSDTRDVTAGTLGSGTLEVLLDDGWTSLGAGDVIPGGRDLRTSSGAVVGLGGGAVELAPDTRGRRVDDDFDLVAGAVVVVDDVFVEVRSGLVTMSGRGAWRLDAGASGRVGVYDGGVVAVDAGERTVALERGEQVAMAGDRLQGDIVALRYDDGDDFDRRLLPDAIAVDEFLEVTGRGLQADYGVAPQTAAFYGDFDGLEGAVVAALRPLGFDTDGERFGPPSAVLTAAVVTAALVREAGLTPVAAARRVDDARRDGAAYGLVTHLHDVSPSAVREAAGAALTQRRELVAAGEAAPVVAAPAVPGPTPSPTTPAVTPEPEPSEEPGTTGGLVDDVEEITGPLDELIGEDGAELVDETTELIDDLLDPGAVPEVLTGLEDVTEGIAEVTEGVLDGVGGRSRG